MKNLSLCKVSLFSSGVGYFEYRGIVNGTHEMRLPFHVEAINDALKSLVINDPVASPSVSYQSEDTLAQTMNSLSVDLNVSSLYSFFKNLQGEEIEVFAPNSIKGRIVLAEKTTASVGGASVEKHSLVLGTANGIKTIAINEINSFTFNNPKINDDLNRALDILAQSRNKHIRNLAIKLGGENERTVSFSYVIPAALWKVSYRLNLNSEKPFLQGWAIVDNNTDTDWNEIELSLITGKPISFVQKIYDIHKITRPIVPLMIDGIAAVQTFDSGSAREPLEMMRAPAAMGMRSRRSTIREDINQSFDDSDDSYSDDADDYENEAAEMESGLVETADARSAGDQFEFTIKNSVNLARQQSAMLPLVECGLDAEKYLVFSKAGKDQGDVYNPAICVELVNNTGMKLPAGPITVYDGGTYA